jgi:hypothetical protein
MNEEAIAAIQQPTLSDRDHARKRRRSPSGRVTGQRNTIFQKCLASRFLAAEDKRVDRLAQEAFTIVVAGGEATARVLATASFHIVANKHRVLSLLRLELETAFPDPDAELDLKTLEKLPWLVSYLAHLISIIGTANNGTIDCCDKRVSSNHHISSGSTPSRCTARRASLQAVVDPAWHTSKYVAARYSFGWKYL